jgi:hypothetical protein
MNTRPLPEHGKGSLWRVLALSCVAASAYAQQPSGYSYPPPPGYGAQPQYSAPQYPAQAPAYPQQGYPQPGYSQPSYPPQGYAQPQTEYVSPVQFLPTFGRKFGDMFRRVFYGDGPSEDYQAPQAYPPPGGYPQQGGRSLDSAPPSYQSQYGQPQPGYTTPPPRYQEQPRYQQEQPRYQQPPAPQPGVPQYQTPPAPQRQATQPAPQVGSRMGSTPPPRTSLKSKSAQTPAKKYTPPTMSRKPKPAVEEMPPPVVEKKSSPGATEKEYYPLPGAKPKSETAQSTPPSKSTSDKAPVGAGNSGSFLKGKRASKPGRVISPYAPYQELDVTGLSSGSLALDPTTQKVFEVP